MADQFGRLLQDLRISVTDRCSLRCRYCMPREVFGPEHVFLDRGALLSFEEIARLARIFVRLGVRKIRLTGGEPLLRRGVADLVAGLAAVEGLEEVTMTTNGLLLPRLAEPLRRSGLRRVTVSLDSLDDHTFRELADTVQPVASVLKGVAAAKAVGLAPVKVNTVVQRGVNDRQIESIAEWARDSGVTVRFIEFMDVGTTNGWRRERVVPAAEVVERLHARWPIEPVHRPGAGMVAERYRYLDGAGEVGVIASVTRPFCHACTRARLSSAGELYTCLFASAGLDLRTPLRDGTTDGEIEALIAATWFARTDRSSQLRAEGGLSGPRVEMSYIGG
ncbi:GTP 3',8-cyclase MoaA [Microbispora sp. NBRC 16548]|uniref:GTP 3',8-cyclase MoaA n=1 Tax=Microbispora sp. NBRC 16548 TaxID=3030994 RepID=UPI002553C739|nr:GTP 3',8-cyclase MoaA [Microbispora sp. NBRC 16548]